jgi:hypothetical protein
MSKPNASARVAELERKVAELSETVDIVTRAPRLQMWVSDERSRRRRERIDNRNKELLAGPIAELAAALLDDDLEEPQSLAGHCETRHLVALPAAARQRAFELIPVDRVAAASFQLVQPAPRYWFVAEVRIGGATEIVSERPEPRDGISIVELPEDRARETALEQWRRNGSQAALIPSLDSEAEAAAEEMAS